MAYNFLPVERDQSFLLPPSMKEWLPEDHLAFFPYFDLPQPEPPSGFRQLPERTLYRDFVLNRVRLAGVLGGLLSLFGGVAVISIISVLALRGAPPRWFQGALAIAVVVWSLPWIGWLLMLWAPRFLDIGYWSVVASIAVVAVGTALAAMNIGRREAGNSERGC